MKLGIIGGKIYMEGQQQKLTEEEAANLLGQNPSAVVEVSEFSIYRARFDWISRYVPQNTCVVTKNTKWTPAIFTRRRNVGHSAEFFSWGARAMYGGANASLEGYPAPRTIAMLRGFGVPDVDIWAMLLMLGDLFVSLGNYYRNHKTNAFDTDINWAALVASCCVDGGGHYVTLCERLEHEIACYIAGDDKKCWLIRGVFGSEPAKSIATKATPLAVLVHKFALVGNGYKWLFPDY